MFLRFLFFLLTLFFSINTLAQDNLTALAIPELLKENANAVVRLNRTEITISSRKSMKIERTRVVTIFGEHGIKYMDASEHFDNSTRIKSIEAVIYNSLGKEIKKIRKKDFKERAVSDGSIVTDNRVLYLDYTPVQYPFTIVYSSETETSNTAFIPKWSPVEGIYVSTEESSVIVNHEPELGFKYKEYNFDNITLIKETAEGKLTLKAENIPALKSEEYSPSLHKIIPYVLFGLEKFHLEGVDGEATSWESFGGWIYNSLLTGTDEVPAETQDKIKALVGNETDPLKKARIVYEYVQGKTRYISIQLGIGGWKPMPAKDVDRLGYGDCKALTNNTRSLLKVVGVESYYTIVYAGRDRHDIHKDFVSMQGNHVILAIPDNGKLVWLECTHQTIPFGFQGDFTDNRMALLVKQDGGELVRTKIFDTKANTQVSKGHYSISPNGAISGDVLITSGGLQYDNKFFLESRSGDELNEFYKSGFGNINNLKLKKTALKNNKAEQQFTEDLSIEAEGYCSKSGDRLMFAVNAFNQYSNVPQRYRSRTNPFEIAMGFYDTDEITIDLPAGFAIEAKPEDITIKEKFGEYKAEYITKAPGKLLYRRSLQINEGFFSSDEYEDFRQFREKIARNDNAKIVLVKN